MSICTMLSKVEVQKLLYENDAKVPPMPAYRKDEDGIDEYSAEGELGAGTIATMDIYAGGHDFAVLICDHGEWSTDYEGDDFQEALRAYRRAAVGTTLPL